MIIILDAVVEFLEDGLIPIICAMFVVGLILKFIIRMHFKVNQSFTRAIRKHAEEMLTKDSQALSGKNFQEISNILLERAYDSYVIQRRKFGRRNGDGIRNLAEYFFHFDEGIAQICERVKIQRLQFDIAGPQWDDYTDRVYSNTKNWNYILGYLPTGPLIRLIAGLPGLLVIFGILGTFVGITAGLPFISQLDPTNSDGATELLNKFVAQVNFALTTSIIGIIFSIIVTVVNSIFATDAIQDETTLTFQQAMADIWLLSSERELFISGKAKETPNIESTLTLLSEKIGEMVRNQKTS